MHDYRRLLAYLLLGMGATAPMYDGYMSEGDAYAQVMGQMSLHAFQDIVRISIALGLLERCGKMRLIRLSLSGEEMLRRIEKVAQKEGLIP